MFRDTSVRLATMAATILVVTLAALCLAPRSHAKLQPYYVLRSSDFGELRPRVLFVVDTSNSMKRAASSGAAYCGWNDCEGADALKESRMAAARRSIKAVVESTSEVADFAMMTFEYVGSPTSVPAKCSYVTHAGAHVQTRFAWIDRVSVNGGAYDVNHYPGYVGSWSLCDGAANVPYPYLRWDQLGNGSVIAGDDQTGAVPASPMISTAQADMLHRANADRKVQWFPRFMGVRANLNNTTDPDGSILGDTIGDYASTDADRLTQVKGQDFYFWPYVDGFPGYTTWAGRMLHASPVQWTRAGVASGNPTLLGQLYAPFYLDLSDTTVPADKWGPASRDAGRETVETLASPLIEGGVEPHSGGITPWASTIGEIPVAATEDNSTFSHSTVASYLKFVTTASGDAVCSPTSLILLTDGYPYPSSEGGTELYSRLAALRTELATKVYVVGLFLANAGQLNHMACAGAGACDFGTCTSPCTDTPTDEWDTCANPDDPTHECAYTVSSAEELAATLTEIVKESVEIDLETGPTATVNEFDVSEEVNTGDGDIVQTSVGSHTEFPGWKGHVVRSLCEAVDEDGDLEPYCDPTLAAEFTTVEHTFGPCPQSRQWDAGECLRQTTWSDRRLYTSTADNTVIPISDTDGSASAEFAAELLALGLIDEAAQADAVAAFILGEGWPGDWKLPGLANSAPVVVRRVPRFRPNYAPSVAIRDPHCAGRAYTADLDVPESLESFAKDAWDEDLRLSSPADHYEYQEAVLAGDDLGVLHAFQLDSGNELWGYLPGFLLESAVAQYVVGPATRGQPAELDDHIYGVAATANQGWVWDPTDERWRHLVVFGVGAGGHDYVALDAAHMSPSSAGDPLEVLWTTRDHAEYATALGETWSRPAITYRPTADAAAPPEPKLVMGSGYMPTDAISKTQGRELLLANALTGEVEEHAVVEMPASTQLYDTMFGLVGDPAVATHCLSRFWAEMEEVYVADPAGRLFRWDLGATTDHEADSGGVWGTAADPVVRFGACQGKSGCAVATSTGPGDVFTFGPSVSALDRIDDFDGTAVPPTPKEEFLVALASGSPFDDAISDVEEAEDGPVFAPFAPGAGGAAPDGSLFHSSIYVLVDDHRTGKKHGGFTIPSGAPLSSLDNLAAHEGYVRLALSQLNRTRVYTPYEGGPTYTETAAFDNGTRPVRAPRILVTGVLDPETGDVLEDVEIYEVSFAVYEPAQAQECDPKWYDPVTGVWHFDEGSTYEIAFRLTASTGSGFDFANGAGDDVTFEDGYEKGLTLLGVTQVADGGCADGVCGPSPRSAPSAPCDNNEGGVEEESPSASAVATSAHGVIGFTPIE